MVRILEIHLDLPDTASEESLRIAAIQAKEAAIVALQQRGELSIRVAAMDLGLSYEEYLDLLAKKGLPATTGDVDPSVLEAFERWLNQGDPRPL
jgi:predicted HTH domain antitoxin